MASLGEILSNIHDDASVSEVLFWLHGISEALLHQSEEEGGEEGGDTEALLAFLGDTLQHSVDLPDEEGSDWKFADQHMLNEIRHLCIRCLAMSCEVLGVAPSGTSLASVARITADIAALAVPAVHTGVGDVGRDSHASNAGSGVQEVDDVIHLVEVVGKSAPQTLLTSDCLLRCFQVWQLLHKKQKIKLLSVSLACAYDCNSPKNCGALSQIVALLHEVLADAAARGIRSSGVEEVEVIDGCLRVYSQFASHIASLSNFALSLLRSSSTSAHTSSDAPEPPSWPVVTLYKLVQRGFPPLCLQYLQEHSKTLQTGSEGGGTSSNGLTLRCVRAMLRALTRVLLVNPSFVRGLSPETPVSYPTLSPAAAAIYKQQLTDVLLDFVRIYSVVDGGTARAHPQAVLDSDVLDVSDTPATLLSDAMQLLKALRDYT